MTPQDTGESNQPIPNPEQTNCTLHPLADQGPDALAPDEADGILAVKLRRVEIGLLNAFHEVLTRASDDLFRSASSHRKRRRLFPLKAQLLRATLAFHLKGFPTPHTVEITPPRTITLQFPEDAPHILPFLRKHHFLLAQAAQGTVRLLLALSLALAPTLDDNDFDDDDDDGDSDRIAYHHSRPPCASRFTFHSRVTL